MLHYLLGILDLIYFYETNGIALTSFFIIIVFKFHECLSDIYCNTEKKGKVAGSKK